jgi:tetratricopeptide (TPR) repeat protein
MSDFSIDDSPNLLKIVLGVTGLIIVISLGVLLGLEVTTVPDDNFQSTVPPELEAIWLKRDWDGAIVLLEGMWQNQPDSKLVQGWLSHTYTQKAIQLRHKGFIQDARSYFKKAIDIAPEQSLARQEYQLAEDYLLGTAHYQAGEWSEAIDVFEKVWHEDQNYVNVRDLLYSAYYNQGLAYRAVRDFTSARDMFESAIRFHPDMAEPRLQITEVEFALAPETPVDISRRLVEGKLIVVGLIEQRMWVYQDDKRVFDFTVSTGEPGRETAIGDFEILNKIDVAYASTWNLDMPYWMGIYWSGSMQNGIHSLPIVRDTGYKLWDGFLGQRVSYGCVILSDEDAATLYNWAEIGVPMKIVLSLDDWRLPE